MAPMVGNGGFGEGGFWREKRKGWVGSGWVLGEERLGSAALIVAGEFAGTGFGSNGETSIWEQERHERG